MSTTTDPFSSASELWILPPPRLSGWFPRVDWYLNWQLSKGLAYSGIHLPNETLRLKEEYETPLPPVSEADPHQPLLVLSHHRLPAEKCVVVEADANLKSWLERIHQIALDLNVKTAHVFLPAKAKLDDALKAWGNRPVSATFSSDEASHNL